MHRPKHISEVKNQSHLELVIDLVSRTPEAEFYMPLFYNVSNVDREELKLWDIQASCKLWTEDAAWAIGIHGGLPQGTKFCLAGLVAYNYGTKREHWEAPDEFLGEFLGLNFPLAHRLVVNPYTYSRNSLGEVKTHHVVRVLKTLRD